MRSTPSLRSFPKVAFETISGVCLTDDGPLSSFQGRSSSVSSFHASLLQVIVGLMSLAALCSQIVSQAPQHFSSSETQVISEGCLARHGQFLYSVIFHHSGAEGSLRIGALEMIVIIIIIIPTKRFLGISQADPAGLDKALKGENLE